MDDHNFGPGVGPSFDDDVLGGFADGALVGLLDEARRADAVAARSRQRWLREQSRESATFAGTLIDLGEARRSVVVETTGGRRHVGRLREVGVDVCLLETVTGQLVAIVLDAVELVRTPDQEWPSPSGDRRRSHERTFHAYLADLVADRQRGSVSMGARSVTGRLWSLGADVVTVNVDGRSGGLASCHLRTVTEVITDLVDTGARR